MDSLLKVRPPSPQDRDRIERLAHAANDVGRLLEGTADLLHRSPTTPASSRRRGPAWIPSARSSSCGCARTGLAVFVSEAGIVTNKLVQLEFPMAAADLERAANYLNEKIHALAQAAETLGAVREQILADMRADQSALHDLSRRRSRLAEQTFASPDVERVLVDGEESFLDAPEFANVRKARALLKAFAEKDRILRVLDRVLTSQEVQIFIGAESEFAAVPDVSVVAAPYGRGDHVLGTLAVVGPTRMNYARGSSRSWTSPRGRISASARGAVGRIAEPATRRKSAARRTLFGPRPL